MLALSRNLLRLAHAGSRALDDGNQCRARGAAEPPAPAVSARRFWVLASPIDGLQRALIDNDVLACLLVSYRPLANASHELTTQPRA